MSEEERLVWRVITYAVLKATRSLSPVEQIHYDFAVENLKERYA